MELATGAVEGEVARRRPVLSTLNALHLNRAGTAWTLFSDVYAAALAFLAASGILILRGRDGISGRGWWLMGLGILLPVILYLAAGRR